MTTDNLRWALAKLIDPNAWDEPVPPRRADEFARRKSDALAKVDRVFASAPGGESGIAVDVHRTDTSRGPDFFVRFRCGGRSVTPCVFRERFKAEYEAAHYSWVFGLRDDAPDLMAYDETAYPNEAAAPGGEG